MKSALSTIALVLLSAAALGVLLGPKIIHGLDRGEVTVSVEAVGPGFAPESRNLVIRGARLDAAHAVDFSKTDEQGRTKERKTYLPLVEADWSTARPVRALYATPTWDGYGLDEVLRRTELRGVLRTVFWEAPPADVLDRLRAAGLTIAEGAVLVDERP